MEKVYRRSGHAITQDGVTHSISRENYVLTGIYMVDGYGRFAGVKRMDAHSEQFIVHFLEYDEYLEDSTVSRKRREGDVLKGSGSTDMPSSRQLFGTGNVNCGRESNPGGV